VRQPETRYKGFWRHLFGVGGVILVLCDHPHNQTSKTYAAEIFRGLDSGIYSSRSLPIKNCALRRKSSKHLISQIATPLFLSDQPLFLEQLHTFTASHFVRFKAAPFLAIILLPLSQSTEIFWKACLSPLHSHRASSLPCI
jgi:hypothetical protein